MGLFPYLMLHVPSLSFGRDIKPRSRVNCLTVPARLIKEVIVHGFISFNLIHVSGLKLALRIADIRGCNKVFRRLSNSASDGHGK